MSVEDLRKWDDRRHPKGEAMALRSRCRILYNLLCPYTKLPRNQLIAGLLGVHIQTVTKWRGAHSKIGKHVWTTLRLAEIAAKADPVAVVEYIEAKLKPVEREMAPSGLSLAFLDIGPEGDVKTVP